MLSSIYFRAVENTHRSFHEKADPYQEFFALSMSSSLFFPFRQAASVVTLPSALVVEEFLLGASWVSSIQ